MQVPHCVKPLLQKSLLKKRRRSKKPNHPINLAHRWANVLRNVKGISTSVSIPHSTSWPHLLYHLPLSSPFSSLLEPLTCHGESGDKSNVLHMQWEPLQFHSLDFKSCSATWLPILRWFLLSEMTAHKALRGSVFVKTLQNTCRSTQLFSKNLGTFLSFPREVEGGRKKKTNKTQKLLKTTFFSWSSTNPSSPRNHSREQSPKCLLLSRHSTPERGRERMDT